MKKYYCITVLALIVVTLLQGYNMSLQYKRMTKKAKNSRFELFF